MNRFTFAAALGAVSAFSFVASAGDADALLQRGRELMNDKRYAEACPILADSVKIDPGVGARLWLGECYEKTGRPDAAFAEFNAAAETATARKDERAALARRRATALEPQLTRLAIASRAEGMIITLDGAVVTPEELNAAHPVNPGEHTIAASAPGRTPWTVTITVPSKPDVLTVDVPALAEAPSERAPPGRAPLETTPTPPPIQTSSGLSLPPKPGTPWWRVVSFGMSGVGLAALGGGAFFGLSSRSKYDSSNEDGHCVSNACDTEGKQRRADAASLARASTIAIASGAGFITAGMLMYVLTPSTTIMPNIGGAQLTHHF